MVGDGQVADAATAAFQQYWEANAALCGSVLVPPPPLDHYFGPYSFDFLKRTSVSLITSSVTGCLGLQ